MGDCSVSALRWRWKPLEGVIPECRHACGCDLGRADYFATLDACFVLLRVSMMLSVCVHSHAAFDIVRPEDEDSVGQASPSTMRVPGAQLRVGSKCLYPCPSLSPASVNLHLSMRSQ